MMSPALAGAREVLSVAGYSDENVDSQFPIWLGSEHGIAFADLIAFGRSTQKDMSTAVITVTNGTVDTAYGLARVVAAPYFFTAQDHQLDLWVAEPKRPQRWREGVTKSDAGELARWLKPSAALTTKVGLQQMPLFDVPVDLLASARTRSADRLAPIVVAALQAASDSLPSNDSAETDEGRRLAHRSAARLVIGALTALVMRDRDAAGPAGKTLSPDELLTAISAKHPSTFAWLDSASRRERSVLRELVEQLGHGIDYRSLDPAILSQVYEQALVGEDDRRQLGIHYTPPQLATRLLTELPVETVPPEERHVLDPCCGSGTLLVAAHDRLRALQPSGLSYEASHRDLAVHLHGFDKDPFAVGIAQLTLLLHAQPAGNGWQVETLDTLQQQEPDPRPRLLVANPPWRYEGRGARIQRADQFLQWSMRALAPGGLLGFLLPASWLAANNSAATREQLNEQFEIFEIWRLPEGTFSTSQVATAGLLARKRDALGGRGKRLIRDVTPSTLPAFLRGEGRPGHLIAPNGAPLGETAPRPVPRVETVPLASLALILSGSQPLTAIADRGRGIPYLDKFGRVPPYGLVTQDVLWHVDFPGDFQGGRGRRLIPLKKVLASAARTSNSPWRFRVAIDPIGVAVINSVRGIAPHDQEDDDLLHAIALVVGSGFANAFAASHGGDRNISAKVLKSLPFPVDPIVVSALADLGRRATELSHDPAALSRHLVAAEAAVWDSYRVSTGDRVAATARLAGHDAPEGAPRYAEPPAPPPPAPTSFRRMGAVLGITGSDLRLWVNGLTPEEGVTIAVPPRLPGWLAREGATFDVSGVTSAEDLRWGRFTFQPMSWADLDFESDDPKPLFPR